jgi:hypothetical protein
MADTSWCDSSADSSRSLVNSCEIGVLSCEGTAEGARLMAMAYSISFLMYFFLGALSSSCRPSQSIYIIIHDRFAQLRRQAATLLLSASGECAVPAFLQLHPQ